MEYCVHEDNVVGFHLDKEDDYPSLCDENIDHLDKENAKDNISYILCDELQEIDDHLSEHEIIEFFLFSDHLLSQNTNAVSDQDGGVEFDIIEGFLESTEKENILVELTNILHQ